MDTPHHPPTSHRWIWDQYPTRLIETGHAAVGQVLRRQMAWGLPAAAGSGSALLSYALVVGSLGCLPVGAVKTASTSRLVSL